MEHPLSIPDGSDIEVVVKRAALSAEQRSKRMDALWGSCKPKAEVLEKFLIWNRDQRNNSRLKFDLRSS
jgi:hypothetical protein